MSSRIVIKVLPYKNIVMFSWMGRNVDGQKWFLFLQIGPNKEVAIFPTYYNNNNNNNNNSIPQGAIH